MDYAYPGTPQYQGDPGSHYIWYLDYTQDTGVDSTDLFQFLVRYNGPALPPPP